ncbi:MAG TPA: 23S rRNA (pseudouridine(1915)-N(3))-methyltransferase RlmH [Gammaproteobacteria bacterium]|nr:23S rRNA (pseudouridine(1915)-N(3))-methyltransferase RlmH [Gammaproteobacteria bacterium]
MRLHLLCVGARQPRWINQGFESYARRMPRECSLALVEVSTRHRGGAGDLKRALDKEGERLIQSIPEGALVIALDAEGELWSTKQLAHRLEEWRRDYRDVALLIGGAEGLAPACLQRADRRWSLSALTLPHGLARVLVAEQLYRAWTILSGHPYHRQ